MIFERVLFHVFYIQVQIFEIIKINKEQTHEILTFKSFHLLIIPFTMWWNGSISIFTPSTLPKPICLCTTTCRNVYKTVATQSSTYKSCGNSPCVYWPVRYRCRLPMYPKRQVLIIHFLLSLIRYFFLMCHLLIIIISVLHI